MNDETAFVASPTLRDWYKRDTHEIIFSKLGKNLKEARQHEIPFDEYLYYVDLAAELADKVARLEKEVDFEHESFSMSSKQCGGRQ